LANVVALSALAACTRMARVDKSRRPCELAGSLLSNSAHWTRVMTHHWTEDLKFVIGVFDRSGHLLEVLARLHDLDAATAAYAAC